MKTFMKLAAISAIAITGVAWSTTASAQDHNGARSGGYGHGYSNYGSQYGGGSHRGGSSGFYGYNNGGHYGGYNSHSYGYGRGYGRGYGGGYRRHGNGGNIVLGVGLGLLTYGLLRGSRRDRSYGYDNRYARPGYPPRSGGQYRGQYQGRYQGQYQDQNQGRAGANRADFENCVQTREYQTTVIVGGEEVPAYGTACLQADGSWLQGPPTVAPR